jgi:hypothetical protein
MHYAIELLYSSAQNQPYRQPERYSPPGAVFKPMFEPTPQAKFVPNTLLKPRRWQPAPGPKKI